MRWLQQQPLGLAAGGQLLQPGRLMMEVGGDLLPR